MKNLTLIILLFVQIYFGNGQLENGKYYFIRSDLDNGYLRVAYRDDTCEQTWTVDTTRTLNRTGIEYRWKYSALAGETRLEIDNENQGRHNNVVSNESDPPLCYNPVRFVRVSPSSLAAVPAYIIQQVDEPKHCLISRGIGRRISWGECNSQSLNQEWKFSEA